jgi:hypothetical protein
MRESNYWLRVSKATMQNSDSNEQLNSLLDESEQLKKILGAIVTKTNKK